MRAALVGLAIGLLLTVPAVQAGAKLREGPVDVVLQDQHPKHCWLGAYGACAVDLDAGAEPGDGSADLAENVSYVKVAVDRSKLPSPLQPILPPLDVEANGQDGAVPNPVVPFLAGAWMGSPLAPGVPGVFALTMSPSNLTLQSLYLSGDVAQPTMWHTIILGWSNGPQRVGYSEIGPFNEPGGGSSDAYLENATAASCSLPTVGDACGGWTSYEVDYVEDATPSLAIGVGFSSLDVTTNATMNASYAFVNDTASQLGPAPEKPFHAAPPRANLTHLPSDWTPGTAPVSRATAPRAPPPPVTQRTSSAAASLVPHANAWPVVVGVAAGSLLLVILAALYSRIHSKRQALESEARAKILDAVAGLPGISPAVIGRSLGMSRNTVLHHVHILEKMRLLRVERLGRRVIFYAAGASRGRLDGLTPGERQVVAELNAAPEGIQGPEIVRRLATLPRRTVYYSLASLEDKGLVQRSNAGKWTSWRLVEGAAPLPAEDGSAPA